MSILRQAVEPMTTRDIALETLVNRALNTEDQKLLSLKVKRVGVALRLQRNNGIVRSASGPGQYMLGRLSGSALRIEMRLSAALIAPCCRG